MHCIYTKTITSLEDFYLFFFLSYQRTMFNVITAAVLAINSNCVPGNMLRVRNKTVKKKVFFCFGEVCGLTIHLR